MYIALPKARHAPDLVSKFHAAEDQCEGTQLLSMLSWIQSKASPLQCEGQGLEAVPYPVPKVQKTSPRIDVMSHELPVLPRVVWSSVG